MAGQLWDIGGHWARAFIEALASRNIISGFPDGSFRPDGLLTRAQFAALLRAAFTRPKIRDAITFKDVAARHWAAEAIRIAYETGFLSGYPNQQFQPDFNIPRVQVLVALINGLGRNSATLTAADLDRLYSDASAIPNYGVTQVAAATQLGAVVNHPDLRQLDPNRPATRAEVAVMIYQMMRTVDPSLPAIASSYLVTPPAATTPPGTASVSHQREFRAAWIASVWNINWPSRPALSSDQQKSELIAILDRLASLNFNAVILQVRPEGDALYASSFEPWSRWLTGTQGRAPSPYYDPLEFAIAECRKRNLELHAWFNPYRARSSTSAPVGVAPHVEAVFPNAVYTYGTQRWMDPGLKEVQNRTYDVIMDVARRYDIDGIHLDDYFYPYPIPDLDFPDRQTYYSWGGGRSIEDWRRHNVNTMVQRLATGLRSLKPHLKFGISPFGIYRPGQPAGIVGLDQYNALFADPKYWLQEGWLDYVAPQLYWRTDQTAQSYSALLQWWLTTAAPKQTQVYVGNNLVQLGSSTAWSTAEFERQIQLVRDRAGQGGLGNIFYNVAPLMENRAGINDRLRSGPYARPALPPVLKAIGNGPTAPASLTADGRTLRWSAGGSDLRQWTLYRQNGGTWTLDRILGAASTAATVTSGGTYALCAVDRTGRESPGRTANVT